MNRICKAGLALWLALVLALGAGIPVSAAESELDGLLKSAADYVYQTVSAPEVGSIGGEWAVLGLARSGLDIPDSYFEDYYKRVEDTVRECKGILHESKYTEYSRVIVALTAIGKNPADVAGYNLLTALGDYDKTIWQGLNGPIWALIALDCGGYDMPENPDAKTQAMREMYLKLILDRQLPDGGWSLTGTGMPGETSDPDITGMALTALARYQDREEVAEAIHQALLCMSKQQDENGGFTSWGGENSQSCAQMLVALCELGIPLDDPRFVKNGNTILDALLSFRTEDGGYSNQLSGSVNPMSSEQGLYALAALRRFRDGKSSLYRIDDPLSLSGSGQTGGVGLPGKNADVRRTPVEFPGKTFPDVAGHPNQAAVEALASRGIISGKEGGVFDPDATMTRAEFASIVVRALGLAPKANGRFADVPETEWFAAAVGTANTYGVVNGTSDTTFNPLGTITRQEAAVMVAKASALCGLDVKMDAGSVRDTLALFPDYVQSADWARESLAFCYREGILDADEIDMKPVEAVRRGEIAQMLYRMLELGNLL